MSGASFRRLYLLVILLHLVSDVALSPFYPQLFERLFGVTDPAATGVYIWVCRVTALVAMPLWGLIARRLSLSTLVMWSLGAAAVLELALAVSPTYPVFLALSAVQVAVTMAFTLAYPAFVGTGTDRVRDVTVFAYVINGGTVVATLIGAGIMALPQPRWGIAACALLYVALAMLCHRRLPQGRRSPAVTDSAEAAGPRSAMPRGAVAAIAAVSAIVLAVEIARLIVRPFFTLYAEDGGVGTTAAAVLFLLPQAAVLAVLPLAGRAHALLGRALLPVACLLAAAGLAGQFLTGDPALLALGRVVFGVGLGLGHVALDLRVFAVTGTDGPAFSAVATVRVAATLVSPVAATALAAGGLGLPLLAGAALFAVLALLLSLPSRLPPPPPSNDDLRPTATPAPAPGPSPSAPSDDPSAHRTESPHHV
ncbi:MFS transporter [Nocardiopsis sp. CC223A]|uniref:MFS transporter n=1 Tax=Nocardiopsis sp. CC223A TaxID=3044051 RepID=UPI00278BFCFC|nr:MFS transporter [Nocardiopsis sp. CC223A]